MFRGRAVALHYLQRGTGEAVLLVHGLGSSGADWAFQAAVLEPRFRVIVPDLPGSGHSPPPHGGYSIAGFAAALWALVDHLRIERVNLVGFSLGGAVALEMALQRPAAVGRLALINALACYRIDHWRKWLEARAAAALVRLLGMRRSALLIASRLFPDPWQLPMRERAALVLGAASPQSYLAGLDALERWCASERLGRLRSRTLVIAAEFDYTSAAEKERIAATIGADFVLVRGSRHGTPFDAIAATNACLLALLGDAPMPPAALCKRDESAYFKEILSHSTLADEHQLGPSTQGEAN